MQISSIVKLPQIKCSVLLLDQVVIMQAWLKYTHPTNTPVYTSSYSTYRSMPAQTLCYYILCIVYCVCSLCTHLMFPRITLSMLILHNAKEYLCSSIYWKQSVNKSPLTHTHLYTHLQALHKYLIPERSFIVEYLLY